MGKTYPRVIELLKNEFEVKKTTKYAFCKATGINPTSVERYLCGISEPNQSSLEKLSDYFGESVEWLRGGKRSKTPGWSTASEVEYCQAALANLIEIYEIVPDHLKETVRGYISQELDNADDVIKFHGDLPSEIKYSLIGLMCDAERIAGLENWRGKPEVIARLEELQKNNHASPRPQRSPAKENKRSRSVQASIR